MRWLFHISLALAFIGLAAMAALPYWPQLRNDIRMLHEAWEQVRAAETVPPEEAPAPKESKPDAKPSRSRQVLTPDTSAETSPAAETGAEPFLTEARRRAGEDPKAAMQWVQTQTTGTERLRGMLEVVALWAAEDSEAALLWLESNAQGLARLETLNSGVELWAERDPAAAAKWIDGMANDGSMVAAAKSLATKWVQAQPEAAAQWVSGLPNGPTRKAAIEALAEAWLEQDPEAASVWAFEEAEFNGNYELLGTTIREYSKRSPEDAEAFVRGMSEASHFQVALASHVLGRAEQDPAGTAQWLSQLPPTDPISSAEYTSSLMQVWAESDSIAASEWLSQLPAGPQRDAAAYGFSESIQRFEPEAAAAWANSIRDPQRRVQRLKASVRAWAKTQPVEALEWVRGAELAPDLREQLAREIPWD
jgi:hypothetical protein